MNRKHPLHPASATSFKSLFVIDSDTSHFFREQRFFSPFCSSQFCQRYNGNQSLKRPSPISPESQIHSKYEWLKNGSRKTEEQQRKHFNGHKMSFLIMMNQGVTFSRYVGKNMEKHIWQKGDGGN